MDNTEIHYVSYDPDTIWLEMMQAYNEAGGDILYPGDEKEILLRAALQMFIQLYAQVDNALRMGTLRYALRDYLDIYGENRGCTRLGATYASSMATFTLDSIGASVPAGTLITQDGGIYYRTDEEITRTDSAEITVGITCTTAGEAGNALTAGDAMQTAGSLQGVTRVVCTLDASGGREEEDDDTYRERIRLWGVNISTTGTKERYEAEALSVSTAVKDVVVARTDDGEVTVWVLATADGDTSADDVIQAVRERVTSADLRPLTDHVVVTPGEKQEYTIIANVTAPASVTNDDLNQAVATYQAWQDNHIGQYYTPPRLMAELFKAGASIVSLKDENGNSLSETYALISPPVYLSGNITIVRN